MDYEKKYKEALEKASGIINHYKEHNRDESSIEDLQEIFPELKESDDEKIRKALIRYHKSTIDLDGIKGEDIITWLEKQGGITKLSEEEQNSFAKGVLSNCALSFIKYLDAHSYEGKMCVSNGECEDIENAFHNAMWDRLHRYYCKYIEKQSNSSVKWQKNTPDNKPSTNHSVLMKTIQGIAEGEWQGEHWIQYRWSWTLKDSYVLAWMELSDLNEQGEQEPTEVRTIGYWHVEDAEQKPADKVKPKFKVGDFIVYDYCMGKVIALTDDAYLLDIGQGIPFSCEDNMHLWTIKDANEGNIIAGKIDGDNYILIFKTIKDGWIETYGHYYNAVNRFCVPSQLFCRSYQGTFTPATKEQIDLLFQNMHEAGYEWDAEKKELKKIEEDGVEYKKQVMSEMVDLVTDYIKQKPKSAAWSDEDEAGLTAAMWAIKQARTIAKDENDMGNLWYAEKWLKSLKDRIGG